MNRFDNPLSWSINCGTWLATQVRMSVWLPIMLAAVTWKLGLERALTFSAILTLSVLLHEFGHVMGARLTGGAANEILLWPLGGLAFTQPANTLRSQLLTVAAGPLVNAALCLMTLPAVLQAPGAGALNPFEFPAVDLRIDAVQAVLILTFYANWLLLLVNLLPIYPLDGGQMTKMLLTVYWGREASTGTYITVGIVASLLMSLLGVALEKNLLVFLGSSLMVMNVFEFATLRMGDTGDESFMGYDFSQGYTSLERSASSETQAPPAQPGLLQRWRKKRDEERARRDEEQSVQMEQQVDALLEKVHQHGIDSLTAAERKLLTQAGQRYKNKDKPAT